MRSEAKIDFSRRVSPALLPELMDGDCSYEEFRACLRSLMQVNQWLLGHRPTLAWLERRPRGLTEPLHIVDVGCGGGDLLREIAIWSRRRGAAIELTGIDLNPYAARAAAEFTRQEHRVRWVTGDAFAFRPDRPIDVIVSSLMAHHLEDEKVVRLLQWMDETARAGWFINDLERSERASRWFGRLAKVVGWHRFVQHDGPVSFRRAFLEEDWAELLAAAGLARESVLMEHWRPGRLCVGRWK